MFLTLLTGAVIGGKTASWWKKSHKRKCRKALEFQNHNTRAGKRELPVSLAEKEAARQQYAAGSAVLLAGISALSHSAISLASLLLLSYNYYYLMQTIWASYKKKGNAATLVFEALGFSAVFLFGSLIVVPCVFLLFFTTQRLIARTEHEAQADFGRIFGELSNTVWLLRDGSELEIPLVDIRQGDTVVLRAGDKVPVDGRVVAGEGMLDQHLMTGEAQPVEKTVGGEVLASTLLVSGWLHVQVAKQGSETVAGQIAVTLEYAARLKGQAQNRAEKIIERGASLSLLVSVGALPILGMRGSMAMINSGFGYQLRMAAPLMVLNYLRIASASGILIKDGRVLDKFKDIDTIVFDKTGTLTEVIPHVEKVIACNGLSERQVLQYAASIEQRQQHPVAQAICAQAEILGVTLLDVVSSNYRIGHGLHAELLDPSQQSVSQNLLIGSRRFIEMQQIAIPEDIQKMQDEAGAKGYSVVYLASNAGNLLGAIELRPVLRPQAEKAVRELQALGMTLYIISGDQEQPTRHLADLLGIRHYFAQTLPDEKAKHIETLQQQGRKVCFVGDGINDVVALQKADVSVSLHGAASIAQDAAEILLMNPDLLHLRRLLIMSKELNQRMDLSETMNNASGITCVSGIIFFGMGVNGAILLYVLGLAANVANAMTPLLIHRENSKALSQRS